MNFKRYHMSKNLFDGVLYEGFYNDSGQLVIDTSGAYHSDLISANDTTYTINGLWTGNPAFAVYEWDENKQWLRRSNRQVPNGAPITFTLSNNCVYFSLQINSNYNYSNIMLNTGSQPLPYEPYSSEVWHNIPHYIHNTSTDIITTLPAVLYPNAVTATVGLKGNMSQTGTPAPTTPIQPQECGERTGNLFDGALLSGFYKNASFGLDTSGGTVYKSIKVYLVAGTYTVSFEHNVNIVRQILDDIYSENIGSNIDSYTFTTTTDTYFGISFRLSQSSSTSWDNSNIMLNTGSQPLPYEPYGVKIPILNNSQVTNVYLGEVETTRRVKKLVLTGDETDWQYYSGTNAYRYGLPTIFNNGIPTATILSTHFEYAPYEAIGGQAGTITNSSASNFRCWIWSDIDNLTDFQAWLKSQYNNGTPVCVWYVLAESETGIVNEPLRKIGDYADEVSGITIPTTVGANTISVGTTLQPSEVNVSYHGWHPVADVHERESGQWE